MEENFIKVLSKMYMCNQTNRLLPRLGISGELYNSLLSGNNEFAELVKKPLQKKGLMQDFQNPINGIHTVR